MNQARHMTETASCFPSCLKSVISPRPGSCRINLLCNSTIKGNCRYGRGA